MPKDNRKDSSVISQRGQYQKGGTGRWYWDYRDKIIFSLINTAHYKVLDVGCGEGLTLERLINRYPEKNITGIDVKPENISICRQHNLPVSLGSVYDLKLEEGSVDLCILSEVLEHLDDPELAMENVGRILKPGGDVIIVYPNDMMFKIARLLFLKFKEAFADFGHVRQFTPKNMKEVLINKRFAVLRVINIPCKFWTISLHGVVLARKK
jgi:2-polyprenyl-3-methyl-5-hydroxy-6-metoxy-1,4-benzoquinol methylase